jgi:hypothetical protein
VRAFNEYIQGLRMTLISWKLRETNRGSVEIESVATKASKKVDVTYAKGSIPIYLGTI